MGRGTGGSFTNPGRKGRDQLPVNSRNCAGHLGIVGLMYQKQPLGARSHPANYLIKRKERKELNPLRITLSTCTQLHWLAEKLHHRPEPSHAEPYRQLHSCHPCTESAH